MTPDGLVQNLRMNAATRRHVIGTRSANLENAAATLIESQAARIEALELAVADYQKMESDRSKSMKVADDALIASARRPTRRALTEDTP